ncbi:MAG: hypothetical protein FWE74_04105 [Oscillospiraceae bacterium]|nr:hypothetical protein [Oscillospiraceae bacterium]
MNKHDFYKEIMSQYTFDESKIRRNAKRASSASFFLSAAKSKWLPLTSAAAVFAVAAVVLFGSVLNNNGIIPPPLPPNYSGTSAVSDIDRFKAIIEKEGILETEGFTNEQIEMYISFAEPMTFEELDSVLSSLASDDSGVQVVALWNGEFVNIEEQEIQAATMFFNGARVLASDGLYSELRSITAFTAVEFGGGLVNDENYSPITTIPNTPEEFTQAPPESTDDPDAPADPVHSDDPVDPHEEHTPDGDVNLPENSDDPVEIPIVIPCDDGLIELDLSNATSMNFINGNRFVLTTGSQVLLYEIVTDANNAHALTAISGFVTVNPQVIYIDAVTGTLLITGGDAFGRVTNLFIAESESGELRQIDTTVLVQNGEEIRTALVRNGEIVIRTRNDSVSAIYTAGRNGGFVLNKVEETEDILVILGFTNGGFKYARISEGVTRTFVYSTIGFYSEEIDLGFGTLEGELRFMRSNDGSNFAVITDNGTYVWNAAIGALTSNAIDSLSVRFHRHSANVINDDNGNWYILQGTELIPATEDEANALARKPVFSGVYRLAEITPIAVSIEVIS